MQVFFLLPQNLFDNNSSNKSHRRSKLCNTSYPFFLFSNLSISTFTLSIFIFSHKTFLCASKFHAYIFCKFHGFSVLSPLRISAPFTENRKSSPRHFAGAGFSCGRNSFCPPFVRKAIPIRNNTSFRPAAPPRSTRNKRQNRYPIPPDRSRSSPSNPFRPPIRPDTNPLLSCASSTLRQYRNKIRQAVIPHDKEYLRCCRER